MSTPFDPHRGPNAPKVQRLDPDAVLRAALGESLAASSEACVDAEVLAAWADGGLLPDEAARVEAHLAGCAPCQALVATFARTQAAAVASSSPAQVLPFRPRRTLTWLAPLAAAAAVVTWFVWPQDNRLSTPSSAPEAAQTMARAQAPPAAPPATLDAIGPTPRRADAAPKPMADRAQAKAAEQAPPKLEARQSVGALAGSPAAAAPFPSAAPPSPIAAPARAAPPPAPMPPPPAPAAVAPPSAANTASADASAREFGRTSGVGERRLADQALPEFRLALAENRTVIEIISAGPISVDNITVQSGMASGGRGGGGGGGRGGRGGAVAAPAAAAPEAVAPPVPTRWRILGGSRVEHSIDAGTTWAALSIDLSAPLTGGASPNPSTCWLVGRRGLVLLSTDGVRFEPVAPPDVVDLTGIRATSARQATVTTADGRTFTTTDAGRTWQVRLQGFSPSPF